MVSLVLLLIVFVPMLVEAQRAAANERAQRARGGVEAAGDVYRVMQIAYPLAFVLMIVECALRGQPPRLFFVAGLTVWLVGKAIKWAAILALGRSWTFRVITVPRGPLVTRGPYRFLRHPNYLGVIGELAGVALMSGAIVTGPLALAGFGALILKRIGVEERALRAGGSAWR
jgi:methyltransferase